MTHCRQLVGLSMDSDGATWRVAAVDRAPRHCAPQDCQNLV
jgi:hypothetical protein